MTGMVKRRLGPRADGKRVRTVVDDLLRAEEGEGGKTQETAGGMPDSNGREGEAAP